jgi:hypothetical protein
MLLQTAADTKALAAVVSEGRAHARWRRRWRTSPAWRSCPRG